MTFRFTCEYDGTDFSGFQRQKNGPSIQAALEEAFSRVLNEPITIVGSGRTDAGVHAEGQVCSFKIAPKFLNLDKVMFSVNSLLPPAIAIRDLRIAPEGFNARFSAKAKLYTYSCYLSKLPMPMLNRYSLQLYKPINLEEMKKAAKILSGRHDFSSFCSAKTDKESKVRDVMIAIYDTEHVSDRHPAEISIVLIGNGFLRNMVRIIVGTLIEVGEGKRSAESIKEVLAAKDRGVAGKTAPAHGLCLSKVGY